MSILDKQALQSFGTIFQYDHQPGAYVYIHMSSFKSDDHIKSSTYYIYDNIVHQFDKIKRIKITDTETHVLLINNYDTLTYDQKLKVQCYDQEISAGLFEVINIKT